MQGGLRVLLCAVQALAHAIYMFCLKVRTAPNSVWCGTRGKTGPLQVVLWAQLDSHGDGIKGYWGAAPSGLASFWSCIRPQLSPRPTAGFVVVPKGRFNPAYSLDWVILPVTTFGDWQTEIQELELEGCAPNGSAHKQRLP